MMAYTSKDKTPMWLIFQPLATNNCHLLEIVHAPGAP